MLIVAVTDWTYDKLQCLKCLKLNSQQRVDKGSHCEC